MAEAKLAIRRLTLYKHGVGFVEREGKLEESEVQLVFRQSEVNDALKSLLVIDRQGGQVRGIHYETPDAAFADVLPVSLSPDHSLLDLLRSLRGRMLRLQLGEGTTGREVSGQLLGVEVDPTEPLTRSRVAILQQDSEVINLPLAQLQTVFLLEERAAQDLRFFLDSSRNDVAHRTVTLQLDSGQPTHDLLVSYLIPCPTWRVSYRLVAESAALDKEKATTEAQPGADTADRQGELLLQGWGLFDNRLEEDLEEVRVRLVAGQPISFIYDLTTSRIPERPLVEDEARIAPGPVEFTPAFPQSEAMYDMAIMAAPPAPMMAAAPARGGMARGRAMKQALQEQAPAAKGSTLGELFQYEVTTPVSVKRGESALVPILSNNLPYKRELLYNGQKMPQHPVAALRFKNDSGLVLERGPVTIIEDGEYRGEALVPFSPTETEVYLAYAVELGIKLTQQQESRTESVGLRLDKAYIYFNQATTLSRTYQIENNLAEARIVTLEQAIVPGYELVNSPAPDEKTAEFYRWKVPCLAKRLTNFVVQERIYNWRSEMVLDQNYEQLRRYLEQRWLDAATLKTLQGLLDQQNTIRKNSQEINSIGQEREQLYRRQEQLRQNLTVLATSGEEAQLRRQVFNQLSESEQRLNALDKRAEELQSQNKQRQEELDQILASLGEGDEKK